MADQVVGFALADIAGDEQDGDVVAARLSSRTSSGPVISGIITSVMTSSNSMLSNSASASAPLAQAIGS